MNRDDKSVMLIENEDVEMFIHKKIIDDLKIFRYVHTFFSAVQALDYLKLIQDESSYYSLFGPRIILLDNNMPLMTGFEFLDEFAKLTFFKQRKVDIYMLSSSENQEDIKTALNKGCSGYIAKPLTPEKLLAHLHNNKAI